MNETNRAMANSFCSSSLSHKYRITLLVTIEEELAIMNLFSVNGWAFIRAPDTYLGHQISDDAQRDRVVDVKSYPGVHASASNTDSRFTAFSTDAREVTEGNDTEMQDSNAQITQDISSVRVKGSSPNPDPREVTEGSVTELHDTDAQKTQGTSSAKVEGSRPNPDKDSDKDSDNENVMDSELATNDDQDDAEYLENSYFRIPPHVIKGFAGNTDALSKTKKLLLKLSNELKVLSSTKSVSSTDSVTAPLVEKLNEDCSELKKENFDTPTFNSKAKTEMKQNLKILPKKRKVKVPGKRGKGEKKENTGESKDEVEKPKMSAKVYEMGDPVRIKIDKDIDAMSLVMYRNDELLCCMCKKAFQSEDEFKGHASQCLSDLFDKHGSHVYKCTDCCAYFRQAFTLLRHRMSEVCTPGQRRTPGKHLICNFCGKTYPSRRRSDYIHHLQAHKNERPFVCEECGKDFVRWTSLRDHRKIHTGEKPFKCSHCPLTFVSVTGQRNHELARHADLPRKYVCEKCGASFKLRNRLTSHLKQVHALIHMYVCEFCQKSFSRKDSLIHHRKTHVNIRDKICDICGKGFIRQSALTGHMKRHRNERSYFCQECGKGFYTKINLADHVRTHTGDKPFSCTICDYHVACYSNAVKHVRTRHPDVQELKQVIKKAMANFV